MPEKIRDLRTQKIYAALIQAMEDLLDEKSFERITVRELCAKVQTRTATFYNHFSDKYDFFSFMIQDLQADYLSKAQDLSKDASTYQLYLAIFEQGLAFIENHPNLFKQTDNFQVLEHMINISSKATTDYLEEKLKRDVRENANTSLYVQMLFGSLIYASRWWLKHQETCSKEQLIFDVEKMLKKVFE
ncbi:TetR/AcrR family transcriptional regulator [Streptococcus hyointestinalis]|uniref:TetR/AcrR family transcriptional regulator n=1 Tax=Streptococcus hyointestinalis TaxID=1337 RepID=UPI0013E04C48|nr:TetR/AcrR family transcriptional regulator [Streptococcus hyointestinalis]